MIIMEDVTKTYSTGVAALNGINLHIQKGEFVFIVGNSGSGKSTLLRCLNMLETPSTGEINYHGTDITSKNAVSYTHLKLPTKLEV